MSYEKNEPLISIIVPVYNGEKYLEDCVNALRSQTYSNIEIILVNDGSTDRSQEIINQLKKHDARIVSLQQANKGVSAARNYGIDSAKGELISFVDVDDCISKEYIQYLYELLKKYRCDISLVPHAKKFSGSFSKTSDSAEYNRKELIWSGERATKELLLYNIKMSCWSKLFCKKFLDENNIRFDESLFCGEGFNFNTESFLKAEKVAVGFKPIYFYRVDNPNSAMTRFSIELVKNGLMAIDCIEDKVLGTYLNLCNSVNYTKWHTYCDFFNMLVGSDEKAHYPGEYINLRKNCKKFSIYAIRGEVSFRDQCKGIIFWISPDFAAKIINKFRLRKFEKSL